MPRHKHSVIRKLSRGQTHVGELGLVSPEYIQNRLLLPVQPDGYYESIPVSETDNEPTDGEHYAWISTPRWTGEADKALRETTGNIRIADLGSAFPILASLLRTLSFERAGRRATDLLMPYGTDFTFSRATTNHLYGKTNANTVRSKLFSRSTPNGTNIRMRLESGIQRLAYSICAEDTLDIKKPDFPELLADHLFFEFCEGMQIFVPRHGDSYEGRRYIDTEVITCPTSLPDTIANLDIRTPEALALAKEIQGRDKKSAPPADVLQLLRQTHKVGRLAALYILDDLSTSLGRAMFDRGLTRSYQIMSVDEAEPEVILRDAQGSFDASTRSTGIFQRALDDIHDPSHHVQASIIDFLKAQPTDSMTYMITVECFPYFFGSNKEDSIDEVTKKMQTVREIIFEAVRVLQPGGRLVAIPMNFKDNRGLDEECFKQIRRELLDTGLVKIHIREYSESQVRAFADQADSGGAVTFSPMMEDALADDSLFRVLEVEVLARNKSGRPAMPQRQVQEVPNPTQ